MSVITEDRTAGSRTISEDDARAAAAILDQIYSGHAEQADQLAEQAGLGDLSETQLEHLCGFFGVPLI